ncbi:chemotaxis protein [Jannaschia sp. S6380]|uniref:CheR family methyltransferase n=1 Tax=Jannaschia sp. S6380 TaxID=2926408 RepID=UPI001FF6C6F1|nr:CheR family methyltransferase [Jannaschia sp. S6380]MCK0166605.1 chemotaxis protein [Jannaschia sp. S6380]
MIAIEPEEFARLARIAHDEAGLHMPQNKSSFVAARLQRRLRRLGMEGFGDYLRYLGSAEGGARREVRELVSALTTNVTGTYREAHHFELLATHLRRWERVAPRHRSFLAWSAGCASGEEPLSIAATCHAVLGRSWAERVRILATDVDRAVLNRAQTVQETHALGQELLAGPVGSPRQSDLLDPCAHVEALQAGITYMAHNVLRPLPVPGRFDAIFCRNVMIYFSAADQRNAQRLLRERLAPGGLLAIGHSERLTPDLSGLERVGRTAFRACPSARPAPEGTARCR